MGHLYNRDRRQVGAKKSDARALGLTGLGELTYQLFKVILQVHFAH
jgi:hypothetical protein